MRLLVIYYMHIFGHIAGMSVEKPHTKFKSQNVIQKSAFGRDKAQLGE